MKLQSLEKEQGKKRTMKKYRDITSVAWVPMICTPLHQRLDKAYEALTSHPVRSHSVVRNAYAIENGLLRLLLRWMPEMDMRDLEMEIISPSIVAGSDPGRRCRVKVPWQCRLFPKRIQDVLVDMSMTHARIVKSNAVRARVAVVYGTPCPRWHVDKVDMRGLCTLQGPGSVLRDESERDEESSEIHLNAGDVVFMRGAGEHGDDVQHAVTHRSPFIQNRLGQPRIIVQTDTS